MMCGTTPTHIFTLPFSVDVIKKIRIVYSQDNQIVFTKETDDCTLEDNIVTVKLTQKETLSFDYKKAVEIQVRILTNDDDSLISGIRCVTVGRCLDKEVLI